MVRIASLILIPFIVAGCTGTSGPAATRPAEDIRAAVAVEATRSPASSRPPASDASRPSAPRPSTLDARDIPEQRLRMDVFLVSVPLGTVSGNESFWRRVDEDVLDPATYDVLFKNGVRVGVAQSEEWSYFRSMLEQHPAQFQQSTFLGRDGRNMELPLKRELPEQTLFYFDRTNRLRGRSYGPSENALALSFRQAPRRPDSVRVALCPVVRTLREQLEVTRSGETYDVEYVRPEQIYDLNLQAEIQTGQFLVVAPSDQATSPSSIGHQFFLLHDPAERRELAILIVPHRMTLAP